MTPACPLGRSYWTWGRPFFLCLHFRYALAPPQVVPHLFSAVIVKRTKRTVTTNSAAPAVNAAMVAGGNVHAQSSYPALRTCFVVYAQTNWLQTFTTPSQRSCFLSCSGMNRGGFPVAIHATRYLPSNSDYHTHK